MGRQGEGEKRVSVQGYSVSVLRDEKVLELFYSSVNMLNSTELCAQIW